jgi:hypothetical protein
MSAILEHPHRKVRHAGIASAAIVVVVFLISPFLPTRVVCAQVVVGRSLDVVSGQPSLTVSIISPANGGGAPGQTLQAGVFAITNNLTVPQTINSATIAFSDPALFSSATLNDTSARFDVNGPPPGPSPVSPPLASTTFTSGFPVVLAPGSVTDFALEVTLSPTSRNESGYVAFAAMTPGPLLRKAGAPLRIALAILGLATAALSEGTRRRAWLIAGLLILFAIGAPGCGSDSGSSPSSTQTVTAIIGPIATSGVAISAVGDIAAGGLPLKIGTVFGQ